MTCKIIPGIGLVLSLLWEIPFIFVPTWIWRRSGKAWNGGQPALKRQRKKGEDFDRATVRFYI